MRTRHGDMTKAASTLDLAESGTTFPRLLLAHAAERPDAPAMREKDLGIWQAISWKQLLDEVEAASVVVMIFPRRSSG